jgi:hypothetical protein
MRNPIVVEDIEQMRRRQGIDDVELRQEIAGLTIGDFVKLTLATRAASSAGETLPVRITRISGSIFCGTLTVKPTLHGLSKLRVGSPVRFSSAHSHSVPKGLPKHEP